MRWLLALTTVCLVFPAAGVHAGPAKRCVGEPPRQTEDPMSPSCVATYSGDNGGVTSRGVTGDEIRVLLYFDAGSYSYESTPSAGFGLRYFDLDRELPNCLETYPTSLDADNCYSSPVRAARSLGRFVNDRFQTWKRRIHLYATFTAASSDYERRWDAVQIADELRPFAVIDLTTFNGHRDALAGSLAGRGTVVISSAASRDAALYGDLAPFVWSFWPDAQHRALAYAGYVCDKLADRPVAHSGTSGVGSFNGQPRKFAILRSADPAYPERARFSESVKNHLADCDVTPAMEVTYVKSGFAVDNSDHGIDTALAVRAMQNAGISTVLHLGGVESKFSHVAAAQLYFPEIVVAGDLELDSSTYAGYQDPLVWANAFGTTPVIRRDSLAESYGARAFWEATPQGLAKDVTYADEYYSDFLMLATGVQTAGALLTPDALEAGFQSIDRGASTGPYDPAFTFTEGDATGIDDATEIWWDPIADAPDANKPGCYRLASGGERHIDQWPTAFTAFSDPAASCLSYGPPVAVRPA